jgi:MinD superfamily P-loop ATPase
MTFPELCHGCGGCSRACPADAITEISRPIGIVERGDADGVSFIHGKLDVGMVMSPPLIRAVKQWASEGGDTVIDAPPGTSCPVITAIQDAQYVLLVTEPTPFGLNDLQLAIEMARELGRPFGIVVNRHEEGNRLARDFCRAQQASILAEIPDDRRIAEAYSDGILACRAVPAFVDLFAGLWKSIMEHIEADGRLKRA